MGSAVAIGVPAMARARFGPASDPTHQKRVNGSDRPQAAAGPLKLR